MLRENAEDYLDDWKSRQPRLRCEGDNLLSLVNSSNISVVVEDTVICVLNDFIKAFAIMVAVHYVFNLAYGANLEGTFFAVQKLLLQLADNTKVPHKVLTFLCKLKQK